MKTDPVKQSLDRICRLAVDAVALILIEVMITLMLWEYLIRV